MTPTLIVIAALAYIIMAVATAWEIEPEPVDPIVRRLCALFWPITLGFAGSRRFIRWILNA